MILVLCLFIIMIAIFSYYMLGENLTSPSMVACFSFLLVSLSAAFYCSFYGYDIHLLTCITIVSALVLILLGNICGSIIAKKYINYSDKKHEEYRFVLDNKIWIIYFLITAIMVYVTYQDMLRTAYAFQTVITDETMILFFAREASLQGMGYHTFGVTYYMAISNCLAYVSMYCLSYNWINYGLKKKDAFFLIPIMFFCIDTVLGGGRTGFIRAFFYMGMFLSVMLSIKYKDKIQSINWKIMKRSIIAFSLFLIFFFSLRYFRGGEFDVFDQVFKYFGAQIPALDGFLEGEVTVVRDINLFGPNTFLGIYRSLRDMGFDFPKIYAPAEFVFIGNMETNVYTFLMRYIYDFGYIITMVIVFLYGLGYGSADAYIKKTENKGWKLLLYVFLASPLCEVAIEERVFLEIVSLATIEQIIVIYLFYKMMMYFRVRVTRYDKN